MKLSSVIPRSGALWLALTFVAATSSYADDLTDAQKAILAKFNTNRWFVVRVTDEQGVAYDKTRVTNEGNGRFVIWTKWHFSKVQSDGDVAYDNFILKDRLICSPVRTQTVEFHQYLGTDHNYQSTKSGEWTDSVPDSVGEAVYARICAALQPKPPGMQ